MEADAILINKIDVLPFFDFRLDALLDSIGIINPKARIVSLSAKTGENLDSWLAWLEEEFRQVQRGSRS